MNKYKFYQDKKIIGMIILLLAIIFQVFAFIRIPVLTTIHAYTIGMLFGYFNPFFYGYIILEGMIMILGNKFQKPKWLKLSRFSYWVLIFALMLFILTWGHYFRSVFVNQRNLLGGGVFKIAFENDWWKNFTNHNWYLPNDWWGGILGTFIFSFFAMMMTTMGTAIMSTVFLVITLVFIISGSTRILYKNSLNQKTINLKSKEVENDNIFNIIRKEKSPKAALVISKENPIPNQQPEIKKVVSSTPNNIERIKTKNTINFHPLSAELLNEAPLRDTAGIKKEILANVQKLITLFRTFKINAKVKKTIVGATLTKYIIEPDPGINLKKFSQIENNIKMTLAAKDIRMELPIPGESMIGIEIPNTIPHMVAFKDIFKILNNQYQAFPLAAALGKNIHGKPLIVELNKTPHLLIAGATGSGKSVGINALIMSIIMRTSPDQAKFILIDPKMVEFMAYKNIPHLYSPIITDPRNAAIVLNKLVAKMEERYRIMAAAGAKNIEEYNIKSSQKWPYIITIIDELADLMNVATKMVETSIQRLTQKARAAGIHLIIATQRPSTDIITGVIKANIPSRIAFSVTSSIDSKVILDATGAEKLIGKGDMLVSLYNQSTKRAQGAYLSNNEIEKVTNELKKMGKPNYEIELNSQT